MDAKTVGERLRELRGGQRINDVSKNIDVCRSALSMYETGKRIPRDEIKVRIANYFGRSVQEIFYDENNDTAATE